MNCSNRNCYISVSSLKELISNIKQISRGSVKEGLPYRGKLRRGKVTKFWLCDENFPRRILWHNRIFQGKVTKFPYFPHKCSIQCTNLRVDVNSSNVVPISGQGLSTSFLCYQCSTEIEIHGILWNQEHPGEVAEQRNTPEKWRNNGTPMEY